MRVALDLMGGDNAPGAVCDGALLALTADPTLTVTVVGPADVISALLADRTTPVSTDPGLHTRLHIAPASEIITMTDEPARAVRAKRDASIRVAARLVRDGTADALVSVGPTGATMAAATLTLGRLPGVARPALAVALPTHTDPLVLLDVGANVTATPELLLVHALAGAAYARLRLGVTQPRVGLLTVGTEPGKGDDLRKAAFGLFAAAHGEGFTFIGNVEGDAVATGGVADVIVTDGFTGNVLLKGLEGAARRTGGLPDPRGQVAGDTGGGILLGVNGVVVVGHGASQGPAVAAAIARAVDAVRAALGPQVAAVLAAHGPLSTRDLTVTA